MTEQNPTQNSGMTYPAKELASARLTRYPSYATAAALRSAGIVNATPEQAKEIAEAFMAKPVTK